MLGVIGNPDWIINVGMDWEKGRWGLGWTGRFVGSSSQFSNAARTDVDIIGNEVVVSENEGLADPSQLTTGASFEIDLNASYEVSERLNVYGGVSNLTDKEPFLGSLARPVGPRGRFLFVGVQGTF